MPGKKRGPKPKHHESMRQTLTTEQTPKDNQNSVHGMGSLTPDERAIVERSMAESTEWETIREDQLNDFSLSITPLDLKHNFPEAWREQSEKRYAFRWCERTSKRIDELTRGGHPVTRWKICTRSTTPFLSDYVDSILGCIARLDQVLLFRPWDRHMLEKRAKDNLTEAKANSGKPENIATRRVSDKIEAFSGPEHKIGSRDEAIYEDTRAEELGDLVVDE